MAVTLRNNVTLNGGIHMDTWSPQLLFPAAAQKVWYDPGNIDLTWRRNLVSYSEQFDNVAWQKNGVALTANAAIAPNNTLTAYALMETAVSDTHRVYQTTNNPNNKMTSVYAKANGRNWFRIECSGGNASVNAFFNLTTGTLGTVTAGVTATITPVGDGWYLCTAYFATHSGTVFCCSANGDNTYSYIGDATRGVYIWGAQLEFGSTTTAYQKITDGFIDYYNYVANPPVMFQDSSGSNVAAQVEQPVGLILDKSQGLVLGSELVTNPGPFTSTTGYSTSNATLAVVNGEIEATATASNGYVDFNFTAVVGTWYRVQITAYVSSGSLQYRLSIPGAFDTAFKTNTTAVTTTCYVLASGTGLAVRAGFSGTIGDKYRIVAESAKAITGNHAYQTTSGSRPFLRARYNLLTYSEQFDNTNGWTTFAATITPNTTTAPDGTMTADTITCSNSSGRVQRAVNMASRCLSVYVKPIVGTRFAINTDGVSYADATVFDLTGNGSIIHTGANNNSSSITLLSNGWYRIVTARGSTAGTNIYLGALNAAGGSTDSFYIWGADLRYGTLPGTYQRTSVSTYSTTGTLDYDPVGQKPYLWFDGTDDSLVTNSINFSGTDKMFVCAGVTKLIDNVSYTVIAELSPNLSTNNNGFVLAPNIGTYEMFSKGTTLASASASGFTAPITNVVSALSNIGAPSIIVRVNGNQVASNTSSQGTGNYGNYPLYIGRRGGALLPFNGLLYNLMIIGAQVDPVNIGKAEMFVADRTGITI